MVKQRRAKDNDDESERGGRGPDNSCTWGIPWSGVQSWAAHTMIPSVICSICVRVFARVTVHAHRIARAARMVRSDGGLIIGLGVGLGPCLAGGIGVRCVGFADRTICEGWVPGPYLGCSSAVLVIGGRGYQGRHGWCVICRVGRANQGSTISVHSTHGLQGGRQATG